MKKVFTLVVVLGLLSFIGCGGGDGDTSGVTGIVPRSGLWTDSASSMWSAMTAFYVSPDGRMITRSGSPIQETQAPIFYSMRIRGTPTYLCMYDYPIVNGQFHIRDGDASIDGVFESPTLARGTYTYSGVNEAGQPDYSTSEWTATATQ